MPELLEECTTVVEVLAFYEECDGDDEFETDVVYRIAEIAAEDDESLADSLEYRNLMIEAADYCDTLDTEITEALVALDDAYDAEEWDQFTDSAFADWESDAAMSDAAEEVDDVNQLLREFKGFLHDTGESVEGLYGSDFDFGFGDMMNEAFFGDFWGTEMNMDKIVQARGEMQLLLARINTINEQFLENLDDVEETVQSAVNEIWEAATG